MYNVLQLDMKEIQEPIEAAEGLPEDDLIDVVNSDPEIDLLIEEAKTIIEKRNNTVHHKNIDDIVDMYLKEMGAVPLLTADEEVSLSKIIEVGMSYREHLEECIPQLTSIQNESRYKDIVVQFLFDTAPEDTSELLDTATFSLSSSDIHTEESESDQNPSDYYIAVARYVLNGIQAKEMLIRANCRLVVSVAKHYLNRGLPIEDLIQEGNIGLIRGIAKYDYSRGYRLSTYVTWWIRQNVSRAVEGKQWTIPLPEEINSFRLKRNRTISTLTNELGRFPTEQEIAKALTLEIADYRDHILYNLPVTSIHKPIDQAESDFTLEDILASPDDSSSDALHNLAEEELRSFILHSNRLDPRWKLAISLVYGLFQDNPNELLLLANKAKVSVSELNSLLEQEGPIERQQVALLLGIDPTRVNQLIKSVFLAVRMTSFHFIDSSSNNSHPYSLFS